MTGVMNWTQEQVDVTASAPEKSLTDELMLLPMSATCSVNYSVKSGIQPHTERYQGIMVALPWPDAKKWGN